MALSDSCSEPQLLRGCPVTVRGGFLHTTTHECDLGWPHFLPGYPNLTTDNTLPRRPHHTPALRAVPSPTAPPASLRPKPTPSPFSAVANDSSGTAAPVKDSRLLAVVPSPTTTVSNYFDPAHVTPNSTTADRPSTTATPAQNNYCTRPRTHVRNDSRPRARNQALSEVLSAAENGSPRPSYLFITTTVHDRGLLPSTSPFPGIPNPPSTLSPRCRQRLLQDRHDGSRTPSSRPADIPETRPTHDRPFRSSSRSRSR